MDPNTDVEPPPAATLPMPQAVVHVGKPGSRTSDAYERQAAEVFDFLVRTVRHYEAAAGPLANTFTRALIEVRGGTLARPAPAPRPPSIGHCSTC